MKAAITITSIVAIAAFAYSANAGISLSWGSKTGRPGSMPTSMSAITWAGGTTYYANSDDAGAGEGRLYKLNLVLDSSGTKLSSVKLESNTALENVYDLEGIAYDFSSDTVWCANEVESTSYGAERNEIMEFEVSTGKRTGRKAVLPTWFNNATVGNYGLESLTISPDGLTMWTANEEALTCDGNRSSTSAGTICRLVKFTRETVYSDWELSAMYAYRTEKWYDSAGYSNNRRGISDLAALPDGGLLVLERDLSGSSSFSAFFYHSIFYVSPENFAAATNIKDNTSLKSNTSYTIVGKTALVNNKSDGFNNFEGMCLGQLKANSAAPTVFLVSDAGDGWSGEYIIPNLLNGIVVRDLKINPPSEGLSSPANLARYTNGTQVVVKLLDVGAEVAAYTNDGAKVATSIAYKSVITTNAANVRVSSTGATATWRVWFDETFNWTVNTITVTSDIKDHDSFEEYNEGTKPSAMANWTGEGTVEALAYQPPMPPGYPLTRESHTRVFAADNATRPVAGTTGAATKYDMMIQVMRPTLELTTDESGSSVFTVAVNRDGKFYLYVRDAAWDAKWVKLSDKVYENGEWVRVEADMKYITSGQTVTGFVAVKLNGSICLTSDGYVEAGGNVQGGAWHRLNGSRAVSLFTAAGTKLDDFVYAKESFAVEASGEQKTADGIDFEWLDEMGMPRDSEEAKKWLTARNQMCGYGTVSDLFKSGVNPEENEPLKVTHIEIGSDGKVYLEFNGYKGEQPAKGYRIIRATKVDFSDGVPLKGSEGSFEADRGNWETSWEGDTTNKEGSYYKIEAVPTEN